MTPPPLIGPAFFRRAPCPHRGDAVDQLPGRSCMVGDGVLVEIRACAIHGRCSSVRFEAPTPPGIQACSTCRLLPHPE